MNSGLRTARTLYLVILRGLRNNYRWLDCLVVDDQSALSPRVDRFGIARRSSPFGTKYGLISGPMQDSNAPSSKGTKGSRDASGRRLSVVALPLIIFGVIAIMFLVALQKGNPNLLPSALIGKPAPALALPALAGLKKAGKPVPGLAADDLKSGKATIVNFFASWCAPCLQEHPILMALAARPGTKIVGINYKDPAPGGLRFITRHGNPYSAVGTDLNGRAAIEWGVYGMPETFIVDQSGTIVFKHVGPLTPEVVSARLLPALKQAGQAKIPAKPKPKP